MARQLLLLLLAFAVGTAVGRAARRGQPRRRLRRRPALLRGDAGLGPAAGTEPLATSSSSATRRSQRRRHLEVLGRGRVDQHRPSRRLDQHRLVGRGVARLGVDLERLAQRLAPGRPAASAPPRGGSDRASPRRRALRFPSQGRCRSDRACDPARLTVSVTGAAAIAPAASGSASRLATSSSTSSGVSSGRAASWIATSSVLDRRQGVGDGLGAGRAAGDDAEVVAAAARRPCPGGAATTIERTESHGPEGRRATTRPSASPPAARRPSGRRLRDAPRSRRPR